jgi:hypothetical protein
MKVNGFLQYIDEQMRTIQAVIGQLDEVQIKFNAQFDQFKAQHDKVLESLTDRLAARLESVGPDLLTAILERKPEEARLIDERRAVVEREYLPRRQQAADDLLAKAQTEMAELRAMNPELDRREEQMKRQKAELEQLLQSRNEEIGQLSRGLGVIFHFLAITRADRERQRIIGKLELVNNALFEVRQQWSTEQEHRAATQVELQQKWQLESIAVARLQAELDQLNDDLARERLALRRAIHHVVDSLTVHSPCPDPDLDADLRGMVKLNTQTDSYHEGLASVGGMIGLLRGIHSGLEAVRRSVQGLADEQQMHSAYLEPLSFDLPDAVRAFHDQWQDLEQSFSDEQTIGEHPAEFSAAVAPLYQDQLSQARVEAMFGELGYAIEQATAAW